LRACACTTSTDKLPPIDVWPQAATAHNSSATLVTTYRCKQRQWALAHAGRVARLGARAFRIRAARTHTHAAPSLVQIERHAARALLHSRTNGMSAAIWRDRGVQTGRTLMYSVMAGTIEASHSAPITDETSSFHAAIVPLGFLLAFHEAGIASQIGFNRF
jgi:hypothetical protein